MMSIRKQMREVAKTNFISDIHCELKELLERYADQVDTFIDSKNDDYRLLITLCYKGIDDEPPEQVGCGRVSVDCVLEIDSQHRVGYRETYIY